MIVLIWVFPPVQLRGVVPVVTALQGYYGWGCRRLQGCPGDVSEVPGQHRKGMPPGPG